MNVWYSFQTDSCRSVNFDSDIAVLKCNVGQKRGERTNNLGVVIKKEIQTNKNEWDNQSVLRATFMGIKQHLKCIPNLMSLLYKPI